MPDYVRLGQHGDLGYLVEKDGKTMVRLDRPNQEVLVPHTADWNPVPGPTQLTAPQVAMVTWEADRTLCRYLGLHEESKRDWYKQTEIQKMKWMEFGPEGDGPRMELFLSIREALNEYTH